MTAIRAMIVDDEHLALDRLAKMFDQTLGVEVVGTAANGREAMQKIADLRPDLVFLDIQMPHINGLQLAASLPVEERPEIIFVTAFEHYASDAFVVDAADYLLKPVRFDRLWQAVERARRRAYLRSLAALARPGDDTLDAEQARGPHDDGIWVPIKGGSVFVPVATIEWIEAARDYCMVHTATRSHLLRISMRALEDSLDSDQLVRVHRSAFARLSSVVEVQRSGRTISGLVLRDGAIVPVGPNYASVVRKSLNLDE